MILAHFLLCLHLLYKALLEKVLWLCTKNNWNHWKYLLINPVSKLFYAMSLSDLFVWNSLPIFSSEKKKLILCGRLYSPGLPQTNSLITQAMLSMRCYVPYIGRWDYCFHWHLGRPVPTVEVYFVTCKARL